MELTELDCHQFVTIRGGFRPFGAVSSGSARRKMPGKFGTYRASPAPSAGLKILCSSHFLMPSDRRLIRNCLAISTPLSSLVLTRICGLVPRAGSRASEKRPGPSTRAVDTGGLARGGVGQLSIGQSGNLEVEIDTVEPRILAPPRKGYAEQVIEFAGCRRS